jgi:hypothetical protein
MEMKAENLAVLMRAYAITKPTKAKPMCESHTKPKAEAKPDDGKADWVRFKSECVLLKGGK